MLIPQQTTVVAPPDDDHAVITAELVGKTIAGIAVIGQARRVLEEAGWSATIVANRVTVDGVIEAQLVSSNGAAWWQVYATDGRPPVWTVGARVDDSSNWIGCVES
jgi:hypothetical protein